MTTVMMPAWHVLRTHPCACSQVKDKWGFQMTARYKMYAELLARYVDAGFKPQIVRDPSL